MLYTIDIPVKNEHNSVHSNEVDKGISTHILENTSLLDRKEVGNISKVYTIIQNKTPQNNKQKNMEENPPV